MGEPSFIMNKAIKFHYVSDRYGCFSNFAPYPVRMDGKLWPTSEHYFQAQKYLNADQQEKIRQAQAPASAAHMGRDQNALIRPDWEVIKVSIMREVVRAKFEQHADLRQIILSTGEAIIIEHTKNDAFWGDGGDGSGQNMLGKILMEVRKELIKKS